ncbi:hypothetical protein P875_00021969 [Aspergillus parasiticus SU-1]|uniref:Uncharacterized protein n=1 Tax=Aspergillus parasiticus (strain ATCC 56775 / NRRL 5862 / SRRC 143 / SU-1) TaxID=1403190 RepID=A0A0F0IE19_ASPPU|nr:hypothetical protein P875_00021969 [Aspergillus parasiticus SU-1]
MTNQENTPSCSLRAAKTQARAAAPVAKKACTGAKKYNCFLIRTVPSDPTEEDLTEADYIEPMPLDSYGEWSAELKELKKRTRWGGILEPGEFYSHRPVDRWHYHVYQQYEKTETPRNPLVSRCFIGDIHGDVAVVRSSEVSVNDYSEEFSRTELVRTLEFYKGRHAGDETFRRSKASMAATIGMSAEAFGRMVPEGFPYLNVPAVTKPWMTSDLPSE